ncbi:unnamed protein product, partial [Allacma fusca]
MLGSGRVPLQDVPIHQRFESHSIDSNSGGYLRGKILGNTTPIPMQEDAHYQAFE